MSPEMKDGRLLLEGKPTRLCRITPYDLPIDGQAPNAYFAYCILDDLDFTDYNLYNLTTYRCSARNTIWTGANVEWWYSRYTDLTGCTPPADASSLNHDLTVAIIRAGADQTEGRQQKMLAYIASHVAEDYGNSWNETMYRLHHELGYTKKEMWEFAVPIFKPFPRLAKRLAREFTNNWAPEKPQVGPCAIQVPETSVEVSKAHAIIANRKTEDRVVLQERVAAYLKKETGVDYNVWLRETEPEIRIYSTRRDYLENPDEPEWWREERM